MTLKVSLNKLKKILKYFFTIIIFSFQTEQTTNQPTSIHTPIKMAKKLMK